MHPNYALMILGLVPLVLLAIAGAIYAYRTWFKASEEDHDEEVEPIVRSKADETGVYSFSKDRWN